MSWSIWYQTKTGHKIDWKKNDILDWDFSEINMFFSSFLSNVEAVELTHDVPWDFVSSW